LKHIVTFEFLPKLKIVLYIFNAMQKTPRRRVERQNELSLFIGHVRLPIDGLNPAPLSDGLCRRQHLECLLNVAAWSGIDG